MKKAIIIGGTSGIGFELAKILLDNGYKVGVTGIEKSIIQDLQNSEQKNLVVKYLNCLENEPSKK